MDATIEVSDLRKRFGPAVAVDGLSFTARPGQVTGFVGPNGAGKSTTMRMILGLDAPDGGKALVGGLPYRAIRTPLYEVGALLDAAAVHPSRRGRDHLLWLAHSHGVPTRRVDELLEQVGLASAGRRRAGGYSLGMRQRLGIAAALLGDPPVLLLDEPVNGLDPEGIRWIRGFLRSLAAEGRTVLISSHLMSELEDSADHLVVVGRGRLIADTSVAELLAAASGDRVALRTSARTQALAVLTDAGATVAATGRDTLTVTGLPAERIVALLGRKGVSFSEVSAHRATLEEAYMELTRDSAEFRAATEGVAGFDGDTGGAGSAGTANREAAAHGDAGSDGTSTGEAAR
ncbi:ABC transporter ATP-binding protein [Yinghuangia sp. YIM S09857]|uniref:ABC transporter ATP-binding protein n=1 Tax=Yinghuangia sp. YIM S09857 TaxID=3436929 RepID=UPI003F5320CB